MGAGGDAKPGAAIARQSTAKRAQRETDKEVSSLVGVPTDAFTTYHHYGKWAAELKPVVNFAMPRLRIPSIAARGARCYWLWRCCGPCAAADGGDFAPTAVARQPRLCKPAGALFLRRRLGRSTTFKVRIWDKPPGGCRHGWQCRLRAFMVLVLPFALVTVSWNTGARSPQHRQLSAAFEPIFGWK